MADPVKQLKVKTGVVKRLVKDHAYYVKEVDKEQVRIAKLKEDPSNDEYVLKKANEVLQESRGMIGDTNRRLSAAVQELKTLMQEGNFSEDLSELADARAQLEAAKAVS